MSMLRKIQRVGKRASKFQYTATYQSVVVECYSKEKWCPREVCVSWTRRGRRFITSRRPWQPSPDNQARGVVIWPEEETMDITVTLYKGPKDKSYETKEWEFAVIDVDDTGKRKVLATTPINMVRYVSSLPYEHDVHLRLKPVSKKIKSVILEVSLTSEFLKEGKATDDDMMSIASMMSISNLSTIGFLEDEEDDDFSFMGGGRSISPPEVPEHVLSTDELLKWAQEITKDYADVKLTNMTTSWRNGMGFLAIIHYFRPDLLPDFETQSANSIKENNRSAFTVARSLGIACPLTPNMMVTTTIPDKLSVTSFVYQMYQYFTRARQSAIAKAKMEEERRLEGEKGSRGTSPSSPFDISKFDMFASNVSPVTTPPPRAERVLQYSRHREQSQDQNSASPQLEEGEGSQGSFSFPTTADLGGRRQSTPKAEKGEREGEAPVSPRTAAKLRLDQLVTEHAQEESRYERDRELEMENASADDSESLRTESAASLLEDKNVSELPSEIRAEESSQQDTSSSTSPPPPTSSTTPNTTPNTTPLYKYTPTTQLQDNSKKAERPGSGRRKLPVVPSYTSSPKIDRKREQLRKQAQEMLKKHNIRQSSLTNISTEGLNTSQKSSANKYRKQALEKLGEVFGTPVQARRPPNSDERASEGSSTSLGTTSVDEDLSSRSADSLPAVTAAAGGGGGQVEQETASTQETEKFKRASEREEDSQSQLNGAETEKEASLSELPESRDSATGSMSKRKSSGDVEVKGQGDVARKKLMSPRRASEGNLMAARRLRDAEDSSSAGQNGNNSASGSHNSSTVSGGKQRRLSAEEAKTDADLPHTSPSSADTPHGRLRSATTGHAAKRPSSAVAGGASAERGKKKPVRPAPVARPISAQPSQALRRLAEQKRLQEEEREREERERAEAQGAKVEASAVPSQTDGVVEQEREREGKREGEGRDGESMSLKDAVSTPAVNGTPTHKKSLPSPSAWSQHSEDLSQDLLVSQSDYVKAELLSLQAQVQDLEDRAKEIEKDIRGAMSEGNKESEEELMQEWFGLLNKKNEHIKRQIELNIIEKEEDLEKRQFFLNRELRPLMEIPEDEKTAAQKSRAEHLLRELLGLIDERDKLERKKMANMKNAHHERSGLATAQAKCADIVQGGGGRSHGPMTRQGSKDCVIS